MGQTYTQEFKEDVVNYLEEHPELTLSAVAKKFELAESTLRDWRKAREKYKDEAFVGSGNLRSSDKEYKEYQRRIKDLEEENAILKKAMAIFSKRQKVNMNS